MKELLEEYMEKLPERFLKELPEKLPAIEQLCFVIKQAGLQPIVQGISCQNLMRPSFNNICMYIYLLTFSLEVHLALHTGIVLNCHHRYIVAV